MIDIPQKSTHTPEYEWTEWAFSLGGNRRLNPDIDYDAESACQFLAHQIARKPRDLLAHVQRIRLAARHRLQPVLHGALLDLNIALGKRGPALRKHMLDVVAEVLPEQSRSYFGGLLEQGIHAYDPITDPGISVLCKGISGSVDFIEAGTGEDVRYHDTPLEQALASIESSQLEHAREVLEGAIYGGNSDPEQQQLLLDLYRKTDDRLHFSVLYSTLGEGQKFMPESWDGLADYFGMLDE